jgi:primosomal protein N' (replication factor Y)
MSEVAKVVFPIGLEKDFDYLIPQTMSLKKGMRVLVDFKNRKKVAIVVGFKKESFYPQLKPIKEVLDKFPSLSEEKMKFAQSLSKVYPYSLGEFLFMMLPPYLKKPRKLEINFSSKKGRRFKMSFIKGNSFLERYSFWKERVKKKLKESSVLIFFPQLSYLEEAKKVIGSDFPRITIIHRQQKEKEIFNNWLKSRKKSLILSTRVGIFYYPEDLSLIVIEEENSPYYFQEEKPFHHLVDVATILAKQKKIELILSADYPTISTYYFIKKKKIDLIDKSKKEKKELIRVIDLGNFRKKGIINPLLGELLRKNVEENKTCLVLWNKKGFSAFISCSVCGYIYKCQRCWGYLKFSFEEEKGICPYCGKKVDIPQICSKCKTGYIKMVGLGIERLKMILRRYFPQVKIEEWEKKDTHTKIILSTSKILSSLYQRDSFNVGFILDIDDWLSRLNYEATFESFIYLKKLSSFFTDTFYVFTYNKNHYLFEALNKDWKKFYEKELSLRKKLKLPPFGTLAKITTRAKNENKLLERMKNLYNKLKEKGLEVYGPFKEYPFKLRGKFRYSVIVKAKEGYFLRKVIKEETTIYRSSHLKSAIIIK